MAIPVCSDGNPQFWVLEFGQLQVWSFAAASVTVTLLQAICPVNVLWFHAVAWICAFLSTMVFWGVLEVAYSFRAESEEVT